MGFRTLEISRAAEIHIREGQLEVSSEEGKIVVPLEDLSQIIAHGANIRMSTMDLSILAQHKVSVLTLDEKYLPTAIVLPFEGHTRQSKVMHAQVNATEKKYQDLWAQIVKRKIENQARALSIMGVDGAEKVSSYAEKIGLDKVDAVEAQAAKTYFSLYHKGLNRRTEDPVNSRINYGYAVVRSAIARSLVATGFHPTFGIHHNNQLNAFNLADDLIEPFRSMVDIVVYSNSGTGLCLSKLERKEIAHVLHNACMIDGVKVNVLTAIEIMCESLKRIILEKSNEILKLPVVLPRESMEGITE